MTTTVIAHADKRFDVAVLGPVTRRILRLAKLPLTASSDGGETISGLTISQVDKALEEAGVSNTDRLSAKMQLWNAGIMKKDPE